MQNAAYPPQYNAGAQPVPMPEQHAYYAAPAMLGGPVPGRPSYVLPQAPSVGSWPLPPATTQMMAPPPAPAEEPTKVVRAKGVARARWNRDEEERLKKLVEEHGAKRSWQKISEKLGSGRTASGVEQHWQVMTGQRQRNGATVPKENQAQHPNALLAVGQKDGQQTERRTSARWTQDEENRLREAVSELGKGKWTLVADRLGTGRSPSAVEQHWQIVTGQRKSKGRHAAAHLQHRARTMGASAPGAQAFVLAGGSVTPHLPGLAPPGEQPREKGGARWTPDEEHELKRLIEEVGAKGQWRVIADRLRSGRSPGAVEQHWQIMTGGRKGSSATRLAQQAAQSMEDGDDLKRSRATKTRAVAHRWTPQEEAQLSALVEELGPRGKWGQIAEKLASGRTSSGVEQHWKIMHGAHHGAKKARLAPAAPPTLVAAAPPPPSMLGQARPISHGQVPGQWVPGLPGQPYQYQVVTEAGRPVQAPGQMM